MTPGRLFTLEEIIGMLREAKVALSAISPHFTTWRLVC
jgi:hypothetical protein